MHYVRYFSLPSVEAQIIFRRTLAAWAERHPVARARGRARQRLRGARRAVHAACAAEPSCRRLAPGGGRPPSAGCIFRRALRASRGEEREAPPCGGRIRSAGSAGTEVKIHVTFLLLLAWIAYTGLSGRRDSGGGQRHAVLRLLLLLHPAPRVRPHPDGAALRRADTGRDPAADRRCGAARAHPRRAQAGAADRPGGAGGDAGDHPRPGGRGTGSGQAMVLRDPLAERGAVRGPAAGVQSCWSSSST